MISLKPFILRGLHENRCAKPDESHNFQHVTAQEDLAQHQDQANKPLIIKLYLEDQDRSSRHFSGPNHSRNPNIIANLFRENSQIIIFRHYS
jgi:hypothetical protein